jgi:polyhydroxybutyrate depolymerase
MVADGGREGRGRRGFVTGIACTLVLLVGCVAGVSPAQTSSPVSGPRGATATTTLKVGDRSVLLYVPTSRQSGPAALVVVLHGYTGEAAGAVDFFGLRPLADQRGFVIAAPQGTVDSEGRTFWNASRACCNFHGSTVDDSGYLSRVIAALVSTQRIDPSRVYVVGHSNGGFMAHTLACEHADQVAAMASLAGAMDADAECVPAEPVSVLQIHGKADDTILYDGGAINGKSYTSAAETLALWRRADGCPADSRLGLPLDADANVAGDDLAPTLWVNCRGGTEVALWTIAQGSHIPALTPAFTAALFDWFEAHQRAR